MVSVLDDNYKNEIDKMIMSDLNRYGVEFVNGAVIVNNNNQGSVQEFCKKQKDNVDSMEVELRNMWRSIVLYSAEDSGISSAEGRRIFNQSIYCLYHKSLKHDVLKKMNIPNHIKRFQNSSFERWSDKTAEDIAYVSIKIDQIEHNIRKIAFICSALNYINDEMKKTAQSSGTSVQGPYSNLDLPIAERWYLWSDVSDEVEGRRDSIRSSRRYRMGLEDSDPSSMKEGFYWRELRNEPYAFDMLYPDSPYPYRSAIWGNP